MNISISSEGPMYNAFIDVHQISNIYLMRISLRNFLMNVNNFTFYTDGSLIGLQTSAY
jgi:hypothetical protein